MRYSEIENSHYKKKTGFFIHAVIILVCVVSFLLKYSDYMINSMHIRQPYKLLSDITLNPENYKSGFYDSIGISNTSLYTSLWLFSINLINYDFAIMLMNIIVCLIVCLGVYYLIYTISKNVGLSFLITFLLLNTEFFAASQIGANGYISRWPVGVWMGIGFLLLSLSMYLKERHYLFIFAQFMVILTHPSLGVMSYLIFIPVLIYQKWKHRKKDVIIFVLLIGGYILVRFWLNKSNLILSSEDIKVWIHAVSIFNCGHIFIDGGIGKWSLFVSFLFILLAFASRMCFHFRSGLTDRELTFAILVGASILICLFFTPFIYLKLHPFVFLLLPYRLLGAIVPIMVVFVFHSVMSGQKFSCLLSLLVGIAFGALFLSNVLGVFIFSMSVIGLSFFKVDKQCYIINIGLVAILLCISLLYGWDKIFNIPHLRNITLRETFQYYYICVAGFTILLFVFYPILLKRYNDGRSLLIIATMIALAFYFVPGPKHTKRRIDSARDSKEIGMWIDKNMPLNKPILVPPMYLAPIWETNANRGSLLQRRKFAWSYSMPVLLKPFKQYYMDMGVDILKIKSRRELNETLSRRWNNLTTEDIVELGKKYNASCVITRKERELDLDLFVESKFLRVYSLQ